MTGYLLDTNVLSELVRKRPERAVVDAVDHLAPQDRWTSVVCLMELRAGTERHPRGVALWSRIVREVLPLVRVAAFDTETAVIAGRTIATLAAAGTSIGVEDVMIGATALARGLHVATRNLRHLQRIDGLVAVSWWP